MKKSYPGILKKNRLLSAIILLFCVLTSVIANGQGKIVPNDLVKEALDPSEIEGIMSTDPNGILYYNYLTEEGWFIVDIPEEKAGNIANYPYLQKRDRKTKEILSEVLSEKDLPTFNILQYQYKSSATRNYYRIQNSKQVLVIKSREEIVEGFNRYKK